MRDIKGDYQRAYLEEYESYRRAGRSDDAKHIAGILRDHYGHEVEGDANSEPKKPETSEKPDTPERADKERMPEDTAKPKPAQRTTAKRTPAKKSDQ